MRSQLSGKQVLRSARSGQTAPALDEVDARIVEELTKDARLSVRSLAERVNISRTNAHTRLERLLREGEITGFHARVSPDAIGLRTAAFIGLTIEQDTWRSFRRLAATICRTRRLGPASSTSWQPTEDNRLQRSLVFDQIQSPPGAATPG